MKPINKFKSILVSKVYTVVLPLSALLVLTPQFAFSQIRCESIFTSSATQTRSARAAFLHSKDQQLTPGQIMDLHLAKSNEAILQRGYEPFDKTKSQIFRGNSDPTFNLGALVRLMMDSKQPGIQSYTYKKLFDEQLRRHSNISDAIREIDQTSSKMIAEEIEKSGSAINWVRNQQVGTAWHRRFDQRQALSIPAAYGKGALDTALDYSLRQLEAAHQTNPNSLPVVLEFDSKKAVGLPVFGNEIYILGRIQPKFLKRIYVGYRKARVLPDIWSVNNFEWIQIERIGSSVRLTNAMLSSSSFAYGNNYGKRIGYRFEVTDPLLQTDGREFKFSDSFKQFVDARPSLRLLLEQIGI